MIVVAPILSVKRIRVRLENAMYASLMADEIEPEQESVDREIGSTPEPRENPGGRAGRLVLIVVSLLLLAWFGPRFVKSLKPPEGTILDFYKEWNSARNFRHGVPPLYESEGDAETGPGN